MNNLTLSSLIKDNLVLTFFIGERNSYFKIIIKFFLAFYILPIVIFIFSYFDDVLFFEGQATGFFEDYLFMFASIFIVPLFFILFKLILNRFVLFINSIQEFTYSESEQNVNNIVENAINSFTERKLFHLILQIIIGLIALASNTSSIYNRIDGWNSSTHQIEFILTVIWVAIVVSFIFNEIIYQYLKLIFIQITITKDLASNNYLEIKPLSQDKAGGLKTLGNLTLGYSYFLTPMLLGLIAHMITWPKITVGFILAISGYIPLITFVFFFPLVSVHNAMSKTKAEILKKVSKKYHQISNEIINSEKINENILIEKKQIIELLDNLYSKADSMPNWPFDTVTLAKFGSILGAILTSIWLNWLFGKMVQV